MKNVVYVGPENTSEPSGSFSIDGIKLRRGEPTELPSDLATELLDGSDRTEGYEFSEAGELTVPELKKIAAEKGIDLGGATKKDDIVDIIEAWEPEPATPEETTA